MVRFNLMTRAALWQWVEANPGLINDRDDGGLTPLYVAARRDYTAGYFGEDLPLVLWLLDEKGVDVNATTATGSAALHAANSLPILLALLGCGADPTMLNDNGNSPLMWQAFHGSVDSVARLLQDPRVRAKINVQTTDGGNTALHHACMGYGSGNAVISTVRLLIQAGADPSITNREGLTPLAYLQKYYPTHQAIALFKQALADIEKTWLIIKVRCLVMTVSNSVAPFCLQGRVARGQALPEVVLTPAAGNQNDGHEEEEDYRKLRSLMVFLVGIGGGPEGEGMPRDVFRVVMDLLMPSWDPLRRGVAGAGPAVQESYYNGGMGDAIAIMRQQQKEEEKEATSSK